MRLEVSEVDAYLYCTLLASFFLISVYIWKPITKPPVEMLRLWQRRKDYLNEAER